MKYFVKLGFGVSVIAASAGHAADLPSKGALPVESAARGLILTTGRAPN
jgi:hypothetical protein